MKPLSLTNGFLRIFTPQGTVQGQNLTSHSYLTQYKGVEDNREGHFRYFLQSLSINKFNNCLIAAMNVNLQPIFDALGRRALSYVELDIALKAFQLAQNLSMVMTIQSFLDQSEKSLVFGNVAMILGQYDLAQDFFLKSSNPLAALEMRSDIQDNLIALNLAKNIAPEMEPIICRRLAQQIEVSPASEREIPQYFERVIREPQTDTIVSFPSLTSLTKFAFLIRYRVRATRRRRGSSTRRPT